MDQILISKIFSSLPVEVKLDVLTFSAIQNFYEKAKSLNLSEEGKINELEIKILLKELGMKSIPDTVLDLASIGYDNLRRRVFNIYKIAEKIFINHSTAKEIKDHENQIEKTGVKKNTDPSRKFPQYRRRFASSPFV